MAAEELKAVRADLTTQLQQMREASKQAKEECEEQREKARDLESELNAKQQTLQEMEEEFGREKETWGTIRMKTELDGLKQLEEVRQQFDRERDRHRKELERQAVAIERLEQELSAEREKNSPRADVPTGISSGNYAEGVCVPTSGNSVMESVASLSEEPKGSRETQSRRVTFAEPAATSVSESGGSSSKVSSGQGGAAEVTARPAQSSGGDTPVSVSGPVTATGAREQNVSVVPNVVSSSETAASVMQQLTQLVQNQTAMVAAQTRAMSAQGLPPMPHYSGEGTQSSEDGFDKWIEQFEERAKLVGWSEDHRRYNLKMLLNKSAFQTYRLLPEEIKVPLLTPSSHDLSLLTSKNCAGWTFTSLFKENSLWRS